MILRETVIVTVRNGKTTRRYAVEPEDINLFSDIPNGSYTDKDRDDYYAGYGDRDAFKLIHELRKVWTFQARWIRSRNRVDEQLRSLGGFEVIKVARGKVNY